MKERKDPYDTNRMQYWDDDYAQYWLARVNESNLAGKNKSDLLPEDALASTDQNYDNCIEMLEVDRASDVLEVGCGFGRGLLRLAKLARSVTGIDISKEMIAHASGLTNDDNIRLNVGPSEDLPFEAESFDRVLCFAAFDAMYQAEALNEMSRVCKIGGRVLITGKNDNYCCDDNAALAAEIGARKKGHPNNFTDVELLLYSLREFGLLLKEGRYFVRRGDFVNNKFFVSPPSNFYEFILKFEKIENVNPCLVDISSAHSRIL